MKQIEIKAAIENLIDTFLYAGKVSIELREKGLIKEIKEDNTPVSNGDLEVNRILTEKITNLTPQIPIVSEETRHNKSKKDLKSYRENGKCCFSCFFGPRRPPEIFFSNLKTLQSSKYPKIAANVRTSEHWQLFQSTWRAVKCSNFFSSNFYYVFPIYNSKLHYIYSTSNLMHPPLMH